LFSSPSQYSSLFTAIENDYLALVVKGKDGGGDGASNDESDVSSLRELKRMTSKSKRFGFQMVSILAEYVVTIGCISSSCRPICFTSASASASLFRWQRKRVIDSDLRLSLRYSLRMSKAGCTIAHLTSHAGTHCTPQRHRRMYSRSLCYEQPGFTSASALWLWLLPFPGSLISLFLHHLESIGS
jgi:hypothetical protein